MNITPQQLAAVLQRAANARHDVKLATIKVAGDNDDLILVDVFFATPGRRVQSEARASKILATEPPQTCGQILETWLGPMPADGQRRQTPLVEEREKLLNHTPADVLKMHREHRPSQSARSQFDWNKPRPTAENPTGVLPKPIPETPTEAGGPDPSDDRYFYGPAGDRKPKLTRAQMVDRGMTSDQRHEQYRIQGGKHPNDPS